MAEEEEILSGLRLLLKNHFGYANFRGEQEKVVLNAVRSKDAFVCMATGSGKSICYQIPSLFMKKTAVVISPLISLMEDQVRRRIKLCS